MQQRIPAVQPANADAEAIDKQDLADISGLVLDYGIPQHKRPAYIGEYVRDFHCFRVGCM